MIVPDEDSRTTLIRLPGRSQIAVSERNESSEYTALGCVETAQIVGKHLTVRQVER